MYYYGLSTFVQKRIDDILLMSKVPADTPTLTVPAFLYLIIISTSPCIYVSACTSTSLSLLWIRIYTSRLLGCDVITTLPHVPKLKINTKNLISIHWVRFGSQTAWSLIFRNPLNCYMTLGDLVILFLDFLVWR